jgi:hypothetical protein
MPIRFEDNIVGPILTARNVKDYGAVGNGVANDTTAIQNAITQGTSVGELVEIYFPKGTYNITGTVDFQNRIVSFNYEPGARLTGTGRIGNTFNGTVQWLPTSADKNWQFPRRITNRLFVGPSLSADPGLIWENDGEGDLFPNINWLEAEVVGGTTGIATLGALSEAGYNAILGGSRTSDSPLPSSQGTVGVAGYAFADKQTENYFSSYAFYAEARRYGNPKGFCHGFEIDVLSKPPASDPTNWQSLHPAPQFTPQYPVGQTERGLVNGWFSCARPDLTEGYCGDASVGVGLFNNAYPGSPAPTGHIWWRAGRYVTGILIDQRAIRGSVQVSGQPAGVYWHAGISNGQRPATGQVNGGFGTAIAMGNHHVLTWFGNPDYPYANAHGITSSDTSTSTAAGGYLQDFTSGGIRFYNNWNTEVLQIANNSAIYSRSILPFADNVYTLGGTSPNRWAAVYAANGTIQTSDIREKTNILDCQLGLNFINELKPVSYKFITGGFTPVPKLSGETLEEKLLSKNAEQEYAPVPGQRTHWGLIAQDVKATIDKYNVDFGGWTLADRENEDSTQSLRYDQFIAPMIKAIQELSTEVQTLKVQLSSIAQ